MRVIRISIYFLIFFLVSSCGLPYCKKIPFEEEELLWFSSYPEIDTVYFSNNVSTDSLIILKKEINNPKNTCIFDLEGCKWMEGDNEYYANGGYDFMFIHNSVTYYCSFTLQKIADNQSVVSIGFCGQYSLRLPSNKLKNVMIDGTIYRNCCYFDSSVLEEGTHQPVEKIDYLLWSREDGLICYSIEGVIYTALS